MDAIIIKITVVAIDQIYRHIPLDHSPRSLNLCLVSLIEKYKLTNVTRIIIIHPTDSDPDRISDSTTFARLTIIARVIPATRSSHLLILSFQLLCLKIILQVCLISRHTFCFTGSGTSVVSIKRIVNKKRQSQDSDCLF
jgi:hypothetical protein